MRVSQLYFLFSESMDSFKFNHFQFQVNELLSVGRLSLDEVAPVQDGTLAKEVFVPHINEVNQRFKQIENKLNELLNIGNLQCIHV